jgi:hypothetical protein
MGEPPDPGRSCLLHTLGHYHIIGHIERTPEPCLPENPAYEPIETDEITIIGKVMGLWRAPV